jgi:hypothetical protein
MATMNTNSRGGTPSTVGPDTIKNAFREILDDEAKHVSFFESLNGGPDPADALDNDTVILNFALLLEHLEAEFYRINVPHFSSNSNS